MKFKSNRLMAALAFAGLAVGAQAQAQSSVTLYGVVDVFVESFNHASDGAGGSKTVTGLRSGGQRGSRWGLRGVEDLGNGLKAVFTLEAGFNAATGMGDGRAFQRTAMVGLANEWGQLTFGRQPTSGWSMFLPYAPLTYAMYEPFRFIPHRVDNAIRYQGKFGGATLDGYYSFSDQARQSSQDDSVTAGYGLAFNYNAGAASMMAAWDRIEDNNTLGVSNQNQADNFLVAMRANIDKFQLLGAYRYRDQQRAVGGDVKSHLYTLGLAYAFTPATKVHLAYHHERFKNGASVAGMTSDKWSQFAVLGVYSLSKRTDLYASVAYAMDGPLALNNAQYPMATGESKQAGVSVGIRHSF